MIKPKGRHVNVKGVARAQGLLTVSRRLTVAVASVNNPPHVNAKLQLQQGCTP